jgi:hypothetical protein
MTSRPLLTFFLQNKKQLTHFSVIQGISHEHACSAKEKRKKQILWDKKRTKIKIETTCWEVQMELAVGKQTRQLPLTFIWCVSTYNDCQMLINYQLKSVNFINVLCTHFSYKILAPKITNLREALSYKILAPNMLLYEKRMHKILMKLTPIHRIKTSV